jgi:putative zinc finger/helix-turn-helix YgiT family protein
MSEICSECGQSVTPEIRPYQYKESGLSNIFLLGVEVSECSRCGNIDVTIPHPLKIHRKIALALAMSLSRLTGPQLRFLREHLNLTVQQLGAYLHVDPAIISKWESEDEPINPSTERLLRLLLVLDGELATSLSEIAEVFPQISEESAGNLTLYVDAASLSTDFRSGRKAA